MKRETYNCKLNNYEAVERKGGAAFVEGDKVKGFDTVMNESSCSQEVEN